MMTIIGSSIGGLIVIAMILALLLHRIRKSDAGSYMVPWDSAKTAGVLSYVGKFLFFRSLRDKKLFSDDSGGESDHEDSKGITSLTPFLERKGLDFSDPNNVTVRNFDVL